MNGKLAHKILRNPWTWMVFVLCMAAAGSGYTADWFRLRSGTLPASGVNGELRLDAATDELKKWSSTNSAWEAIAGGGGSASFTKWLPNPSGDTNANDWFAYADAASTTPVNGVGGSPNVTITQTDVAGEFYQGEGGFVITKDAANRQGQGVATDFTLEAGFAAKSQKITLTMPYKVSTNYVSGDVIAYVYDRDGTTVQLCNNGDSGQFLKTTDWAVFQCEFYSVAGNDDYRLIFHVAGTTATAWTFYYKVTGFTDSSPTPTAIMTDWSPISLTMNWVSNATITANYRRVGTNIQISGKIAVTGAPTSTTLQITPPSFAAPDTSVIDRTSNGANHIGYLYAFDANSSSSRQMGVFDFDDLGVFQPRPIAGSGVTETVPFTWANGDFLTFWIEYPVSGWTSGNVISSTEALFNMAKFTALGGSQTISSASPTKVTGWATPAVDNLSGWDSVNSRYIVKKTNRHTIDAQLQLINTTSELFYIFIYVNGSAVRRAFFALGASGVVAIRADLDLVANDYVEIYVDSASDASYNVDLGVGNTSWFTITASQPHSTFGVYGNVEYKAATSSAFLGSTAGFISNEYAQMTGNYVDLEPGSWTLSGTIYGGNTGTSPDYTQLVGRWSTANGNNTATAPTDATLEAGFATLQIPTLASAAYAVMPTVRITVTTTTRIYLNVRVTATTVTNAAVTNYIYAERLQ